MSYDSTEIQARIDAVGVDGGGTVFLPARRIILPQPLILKSNVTLRGSSTTSTVLSATDDFSPIVVGDRRGVVAEGWAIENLTLMGAGANGTGGHGIEICAESRQKHVELHS